jgi:hypothetical protein
MIKTTKFLAIPEKEKSINKKHLFNFYDKFILNLKNSGVYFFGLTINFLEDITIPGISCHNVNSSEQDFVSHSPQQIMDWRIKNLNKVLSTVEFIDCTITMVEKSKKEGRYHAHTTLMIRSFDPDINNVHLHLLNVLNISYADMDIHVDVLKNFIDAKQFLRYCSKDINKVDKYINNIYVTIFSEVNKQEYESLYEQLETYRIDFDESIHVSIERYIVWTRAYNGSFNNIAGFNFSKKKNDKQLVLFYINTFLKLNDMFFFNDHLYIRNRLSSFSYICLGTYTKLVDQLPNIFRFFDTFFQTIHFHDLWSSVINQINSILSLFKTNINFFTTKKINFNVLEFLDGLYILEENAFISFKEINLNNFINLKTTRFYAENYETKILTHLKPVTWLKYLSKNIPDEETLTTFCGQFGKYFYHENNIAKIPQIKKNSLFIKGVSSSGKTALLTNQLLNVWGKENITMLIDNSKFAFEDIHENKPVVINDEYSYNKKERSNLLKLLDRSPLTINRKFKNSFVEQFNVSVMFLGNYTPENLVMLKDVAFEKRLNVYDFKEELDISNSELLKIKAEESKIIIYCNKLFFKNIKNDSKNLRLSKKKKQLLLSKLIN